MPSVRNVVESVAKDSLLAISTNPSANALVVLPQTQEDINKAIAGRRCSLVLSPTQENQMVELITKLLK